jgi:hypothetical protein
LQLKSYRFILAAATWLWASLAFAQVDPKARELCSQANQIAQELTAISGLSLHHPVPCDFISKDKVNEFLKKRVQEIAKPEDIRAEEMTLKKFGLAPSDFNLAQNTVDLLTEQAAAFYDYDRKKLFITDSTPAETQQPILAHELSHAVADQNFDLGKYIRKARSSDDGATARLAVMEGQATWLMSEYLARKMGQSLRNSPSLVRTMSTLSESGASEYPVFGHAPLYLRRTLIFPYTAGMLFQNALLERDGQRGFIEVFQNPPLSSQQILHPEKYLARVKPVKPDLPHPKLPRGYKGLIGGSLGELEHSILLEQYLGSEQAAAIAPHWRGCAFELDEDKKAGRLVLRYAVQWDSEESARMYFAAYQEVLRKKWKKITFSPESLDAVTGEGDDGHFELRRKGAIVTSVEGLPPAIH